MTPHDLPTRRVLRAVLYGRVSEDRFGNSESIDQQVMVGTRTCEIEGWLLDVVLDEDAGVSASRFSKKVRIGWKRLLKLIEDGKVDVVIFWEASRGSRRLTEWSMFLDLVRDKGVLVHILSHERTYDPRLSRDWQTLAEEGVAAAVEVERTSGRVGRSKQARAEQGRLDGGRAFGIDRVRDPLTGKPVDQVPGPQFQIVYWMFQLADRCVPITRIAEALKIVGIKTQRGNDWDHMEVKRVLTNPVYKGIRRYKGVEEYVGTWGDLLVRYAGPEAEGLWDRVNERIRVRARRQERPGGRKYFLTRIATGSLCGHWAEARNPTPTIGRYSCKCGCFSIDRAHTDAYVVDTILEWAAAPENYEVVQREATDTTELDGLRKKLRALEETLDGYFQQAADLSAPLSPAGLARMEALLSPQIAEVRAKIDAVPVTAPLSKLLPGHHDPHSPTVKEDLAARWLALTLPARVDIVKDLFEYITISPAIRDGVFPRGNRWVKGQFDFRRVDLGWRKRPVGTGEVDASA